MKRIIPYILISLLLLCSCAPLNSKVLDEPYDLTLKNRTEAKNVTVTIKYSISNVLKFRLNPWDDKTIQIDHERYLICFDPDGTQEFEDFEWCEWYNYKDVTEIEIISPQVHPNSSTDFNPIDLLNILRFF